MPRKSDALTVDELQDILKELPSCKFSNNVKSKIEKRILAEISRRERAGQEGGRPKEKPARETMREIDQTAYRTSKRDDFEDNGPKVDESQDWGA